MATTFFLGWDSSVSSIQSSAVYRILKEQRCSTGLEAKTNGCMFFILCNFLLELTLTCFVCSLSFFFETHKLYLLFTRFRELLVCTSMFVNCRSSSFFQPGAMLWQRTDLHKKKQRLHFCVYPNYSNLT